MLRIATRTSSLALWQARHVQALLQRKTHVPSQLLPVKTRGDLDSSTPLAALGGRGFFTKELEVELLAHRADLAVHSLKDLPTSMPRGLRVGAVLSRADRRDALLIRRGMQTPREPLPLAAGAVLGTSSARRRAQARFLAPDLVVKEIRGNVPTRLEKLRAGDYDAILLAWAGLSRLDIDLTDFEVVRLPLEVFLPAPGQGVLAVEIRADDETTAALVGSLHERELNRAVTAERGLLHLFAGGCNLPLGVVAEVSEQVQLKALYLAREGDDTYTALRTEKRGMDPELTAYAAFEDLLAQKLAWVEARRPLSGLTVAVTRSADAAGNLHEIVERMGGRLQPVPTLAFEPAGDRASIDCALDRLAEYDWVLFTSANAVHYLFEEYMRGRDWPDAIQVGVVGPVTERALRERGLEVQLAGKGGSGGDLADRFLHQVGSGHHVLWPTAAAHREELPQRLEAAGVRIDPLVIYRATLPPAEARLPAGVVKPDWILVTSPAAGRNFIELYGAPEGARWAAIGPTTQAEMERLLRRPVTVAREASLEALAEVLV